jgi:hypothetical protein
MVAFVVSYSLHADWGAVQCKFKAFVLMLASSRSKSLRQAADLIYWIMSDTASTNANGLAERLHAALHAFTLLRTASSDSAPGDLRVQGRWELLPVSASA